MTPYYDHGGRFFKGDPRTKIKSPAHRRAISEGQKRAWAAGRKNGGERPVGSTWLDASGYLRVKVAPGTGRWRLQHVVVMEGVIGRTMKRGEIVHHINGDRTDNRPENLYLCRDHSHHNDVHRSQNTALRAALAAGLVVFRKGRYEAVL